MTGAERAALRLLAENLDLQAKDDERAAEHWRGVEGDEGNAEEDRRHALYEQGHAEGRHLGHSSATRQIKQVLDEIGGGAS